MKSTFKIGLVTAVISTLFLFGFFPVLLWLNNKFGWGMQAASIRGIGGLLSIPIQAIGIYLAMQDIKKTTGMLTYAQALKTGITVAITIAVVVAAFSFVYCNFINPGYAAYMLKDAQQTMRASGESAQQIETNSVQVAKQFTTGAQMMMALVGQSVVGIIISLIIGLFVKTGKNGK